MAASSWSSNDVVHFSSTLRLGFPVPGEIRADIRDFLAANLAGE
jgi:hypothetical protein